MSVTSSEIENALASIGSLADWTRQMEAQRDKATERCTALAAKVDALEAENAALKAGTMMHTQWSSAPSDAWIDCETYSYRRAGDVLLVAEHGGKDGTWWTFMYGGDNGGTDDNGATRDEAKAILDAAVAPKKAEVTRYEVIADGDGGWIIDGPDLRLPIESPVAAKRIAAALNAAEGRP